MVSPFVAFASSQNVLWIKRLAVPPQPYCIHATHTTNSLSPRGKTETDNNRSHFQALSGWRYLYPSYIGLSIEFLAFCAGASRSGRVDSAEGTRNNWIRVRERR